MPQAQQGYNIADSAQINPGVVENSDIADDTILNAKINSAAAIAMSKLALAVTNAEVAAGAAIIDTKLAQIATANKVSGAAITLLTSLPAGAGVIPTANLPSPGIQSIYVKPSNTTGAHDGLDSADPGLPYVDQADAATVNVHFAFFMPSAGTISSIQLIARATGSSAGNVVINWYMRSIADNVADETDSALDSVHSDLSSSVANQLITIPAAAYNGLTRGRCWLLEVQRAGNHANDTLGQTMRNLGIIFNLS